MTPAEKENIVTQAKALQTLLQDSLQSAAIADDLLLFLNRLRDEYRILRSTSDRFKGTSFSFLHELLYQLESRPDEAIRSEEWRTFVEVLLSDIASGRIVTVRR